LTIILHIGSHKTGTTAIQRFASANRRKLRRAGLWYPDLKEAGIGPTHYAHHHLANAVAADSPVMSLSDAERFFQHVLRRKRRGESVLISAEPIYRQVAPPPGKPRHNLKGEAFWSAHRAYLERLRDMIGTDDLKVLVVFRRQDSFAPSIYQEQVKSTRYTGTFQHFIRDRRHLFDYLHHVQELERLFPVVMARPFDRLTGGRGMIAEFFGWFGIEPPAVDTLRTNPSLPHELVEFKRQLNATSMPRAKLKVIEPLLMNLARSPDFVDAPRRHWVAHEKMVAFQQGFNADNRQIHLHSDFDEGEDFFSDAPLAPAEVFAGLSSSRALEIAAQLIAS
jgi:hypothetical protein